MDSSPTSSTSPASLERMLTAQKTRVLKIWRTWAASSKRGLEEEVSALDAASGPLTSPSNKRRKKLISLGGCLLTAEDLRNHVDDIQHGHDRRRGSLTLILRKLFEHRMNKGIFNVPVDPVALNLPTYFDIIKNPMDLGTIKNKLSSNQYKTGEEFANDVRLVYHNAMKFNPPNTYVWQSAKKAIKQFETEYDKFKSENDAKRKVMKAHSCEECNGEPCQLCGVSCIEFQEPVLRCSAPCKSRIQRKAPYYRLGGDRGQHWCHKCYTALPPTFIGILGQVVQKKDLEHLVNDKVYWEPWIDCSRCQRHLHQICSLYSPSIVSDDQPFVCIICIAEMSDTKIPFEHVRPAVKQECTTSASWAEPTEPWASFLPHTEMGKYLEKVVRNLVVEKTKSLEIAETFTLRVVSSRDVVTRYEPRILRWIEAQRKSCGEAYRDDALHSEFPCRTKTILLFQRLDGIDVMLFVLYVQEYGSNCPEPNRNKVYVSYLDSVAYMRPDTLKTVMYQSIMLHYFKWVKARGFESVYIWACPPSRGDAYIMYCHPKFQRTPGADKLRKWYHDLVRNCKKQGIVLSDTNLYDVHLSQFKPLVNTRGSRTRGAGGNISPRSERDIGNSSNGMQSKISKPFELLPYFYGDYLPNELEAVLTMLISPRNWKDSRLYSSCDEAVRTWWRVVWGSETRAVLLNSKNHGTDSGSSSSGTEGSLVKKIGVVAPITAPTWVLGPSADLGTVDLTAGYVSAQQRNDWLLRRLAASIKPMTENFFVLRLNNKTGDDTTSLTTLNDTLLNSDTSDPDPVLPAGIFDTRLAFLDMCKHNHFQFDQLRIAKYSSLLLLYYHRKALKTAIQLEEKMDEDTH